MREWTDAAFLIVIFLCHTLIITAGVSLTQWVTDTLTPVHLLTWTVSLSAPGIVLLLLLYIRRAPPP